MLLQQITDGNKLILESPFNSTSYDVKKYANRFYSEVLKFHGSYNCLMAVVEKIEASKAGIYSGFSFRIIRKHTVVLCHHESMQDGVIYQTPFGFEPESKIESIWLAVIEFIKWYNLNK